MRTIAATARTIAAPIAALPVVGRGAILRWIVLGGEVLRRRFVRIGLALVFGRFVHPGGAGLGLFHVRTNVVAFGAFASGFRIGFERGGFLRAAERFTRQSFDGCRNFACCRGRMAVAVARLMAVTMVVVFEIFEDITDIEEGVAV